MCTGTSTIAYGIVIKTWTLLVAAFAFQKIKPILLALDLILLRKKHGTLLIDGMVEGKMNLGNLPVEIIELVRNEVFLSVNMRGEAEEYLGNLRCSNETSCPCGDDSCIHEKHELGLEWSQILRGDCDHCFETYLEFGKELDSAMFTELLDHYGLVPSNIKVITGEHTHDLNEFYSSVSIPISSSTVQSSANHDFSRSSANPLYFDTSTIDTTGAATHFKRLVTDWDLNLYDKPVQAVGVSLVELWKGDDNFKNKKRTKIEPRWMMLNAIDICN